MVDGVDDRISNLARHCKACDVVLTTLDTVPRRQGRPSAEVNRVPGLVERGSVVPAQGARPGSCIVEAIRVRDLRQGQQAGVDHGSGGQRWVVTVHAGAQCAVGAQVKGEGFQLG